MKKILVPIDFTPASRNAAEYAASLAKTLAAEVYLLHVFLEPEPVNEVPLGWVLAESSLQKEADIRVQQEVHFLRQKYVVDVNGAAQIGYTGDTINRVATEMAAALIVMGMREGKHNLFFGSTSITTVRKTKTPVLVVPQAASFAPPKHIVLASDFSEVQHETCCTILYTLVDAFDAAVQVLHVQPKGASVNEWDVPGKEQLQRVLSKLSYQYQQIEDDDVEQGILNFIQSHPADLLVMVAHKHNLLERVFGTIHTRSMSYKAKLPLLILEDK